MTSGTRVSFSFKIGCRVKRKTIIKGGYSGRVHASLAHIHTIVKHGKHTS